ncbi:unnamed protein product, partial [Sphenostylis stenocarpa]
ITKKTYPESLLQRQNLKRISSESYLPNMDIPSGTHRQNLASKIATLAYSEAKKKAKPKVFTSKRNICLLRGITKNSMDIRLLKRRHQDQQIPRGFLPT